MNLLEWADSLIPGTQLKVVDHLAHLVGINYGSFAVELGKVGKHVKGGPFGRLGLTIEEAMDLIQITGIAEGIVVGLGKNDIIWIAFMKKVELSLIDQAKNHQEVTGSIVVGTESDLKAELDARKRFNNQFRM